MAISVNTTKYEFSHGRKPRGGGTWIFNLSWHAATQEITINHAATFREAVAEAKRWARMNWKVQDGTLVVMP